MAENDPELLNAVYKEVSEKMGMDAAMVEGVHACICGILSDAMEGGYLDHNPAWCALKYSGKKAES